MPSTVTSLRRRVKALHRNVRGAAMAARALASTDHPLLAHIIPVRRCNLACTYCNEFDDFSKPVPTEEMFRRIDKLGALGTAVVTISGAGAHSAPEPRRPRVAADLHRQRESRRSFEEKFEGPRQEVAVARPIR